jgi:hypothetical protein
MGLFVAKNNSPLVECLGILGDSLCSVMHLPGYPHYYVKDGQRRPVYYTAEVRDLRASGWAPEEAVKAEVKPEPARLPMQQEALVPELVIDEEAEQGLPAFEFMTKAELIKYATARGVELDSTSLKADLITACKEIA